MIWKRRKNKKREFWRRAKKRYFQRGFWETKRDWKIKNWTKNRNKTVKRDRRWDNWRKISNRKAYNKTKKRFNNKKRQLQIWFKN